VAAMRRRATVTTHEERVRLLELLAVHDLANMPRARVVELIVRTGMFTASRLEWIDPGAVAQELLDEIKQRDIFDGGRRDE